MVCHLPIRQWCNNANSEWDQLSEPVLQFRSVDCQFAVNIMPTALETILKCCVSASRRETGGILVGSYNSSLDCAQIDYASRPPSDSKAGHTWFERGTRGLQRLLDRFWGRATGYYLGEWHYHPHSSTFLSDTDRDT